MTIGVLFGKMKFFAERPHKLKSEAKNSYGISKNRDYAVIGI